ncbi:alkane 1-monooxygenase [Sphingobacteriales bacterium UPWRP_1]|nr:alkane 1-monooxygenase [Sphingobacteriales bacterium TSM_CSS]PSJ77188.1 alkane 1-monooxygenase [Sphingobacteriales bacterium UPWRP_1]
MHTLKYLLIYVAPAIVLFSIYAGGAWSYSAIIFVFGIVPLIELFTKGSTQNLTEAEEEVAKKDLTYDLLLYGLVPAQYAIMLYFLFTVSNEELPLYVKIGITTAYGIACGVLGINAAHELGHRSTRYEQIMSKMLLFTTLYMHFFIEHNRGHHKNVSTDDDPASSRYGEIVYTFYFRSVWGGWLSAWRLEAARLKKASLHFWSLHNEMLRFQLIQLALIAVVAYLFGWQTLLFFLGGAAMGVLLLETVNYIEHYGLRRNKKGDRYERTLPAHSWNSNHPAGRLLLLELSRHSDHHYMASRKYQILRHFEESPQMPTGYPGMMLLALIPPLWFAVMHRTLHHYKQGHAGQEQLT